MENIIGLLWDKNYHLERFFEMNETELVNFAEGNFDNLEYFYNSREAILDLINCIDRLIEQANLLEAQPTVPTAQQKAELKSALHKKTELVNAILAQDLQILSVLENAKSGIIRELSQVRAAKKAVGAYKSGESVASLDEEA